MKTKKRANPTSNISRTPWVNRPARASSECYYPTLHGSTKMVWRKRWVNVSRADTFGHQGIRLVSEPGHYSTRSEAKAAAVAHGHPECQQVPVKLRIPIEDDV